MMHDTVDLQACCEEMSALYDNHEYAPLAIFLGVTEALQIMHHSHHWQTRGSNFYGDHILFQRLYETVQGETDTVGERLVGLSKEPKLTNYFARMKVIQKLLDMATTSEPYAVVSLKAEMLYQMIGKHVMQHFEQTGKLTPGLEQLLGGILDKHEEHIFLLQGRVAGK